LEEKKEEDTGSNPEVLKLEKPRRGDLACSPSSNSALKEKIVKARVE